MYAARDGVTATSAKSKAAIDRKFLEAAASRRRYRSLMPSYFLDAEAREEKRRLEDELTKEWHPDLSSVKPLVSIMPQSNDIWLIKRRTSTKDSDLLKELTVTQMTPQPNSRNLKLT